jgi:hypothetical protein
MEKAQQQKQNSLQVKTESKYEQQDLKVFFSGFDSRKLATLVRVKTKIALVRPV